MSYDYLLKLYDTLDQRIESKQKALEMLQENDTEHLKQEGGIEILLEFKNFLQNSFHRNLPRAIQRQLDTGK